MKQLQSGSRAYLRPGPTPKLPAGLEELMEGLTREVLKHNPLDIDRFCADHMKKLLHLRDAHLKSARSVTLEDKIKAAQDKIKERAIKRIQNFDNEIKEYLIAENVVPAINSVPKVNDINEIKYDVEEIIPSQIEEKSINNQTESTSEHIENENKDTVYVEAISKSKITTADVITSVKNNTSETQQSHDVKNKILKEESDDVEKQVEGVKNPKTVTNTDTIVNSNQMTPIQEQTTEKEVTEVISNISNAVLVTELPVLETNKVKYEHKLISTETSVTDESAASDSERVKHKSPTQDIENKIEKDEVVDVTVLQETDKKQESKTFVNKDLPDQVIRTQDQIKIEENKANDHTEVIFDERSTVLENVLFTTESDKVNNSDTTTSLIESNNSIDNINLDTLQENKQLKEAKEIKTTENTIKCVKNNAAQPESKPKSISDDNNDKSDKLKSSTLLSEQLEENSVIKSVNNSEMNYNTAETANFVEVKKSETLIENNKVKYTEENKEKENNLIKSVEENPTVYNASKVLYSTPKSSLIGQENSVDVKKLEALLENAEVQDPKENKLIQLVEDNETTFTKEFNLGLTVKNAEALQENTSSLTVSIENNLKDSDVNKPGEDDETIHDTTELANAKPKSSSIDGNNTVEVKITEVLQEIVEVPIGIPPKETNIIKTVEDIQSSYNIIDKKLKPSADEKKYVVPESVVLKETKENDSVEHINKSVEGKQNLKDEITAINVTDKDEIKAGDVINKESLEELKTCIPDVIHVSTLKSEVLTNNENNIANNVKSNVKNDKDLSTKNKVREAEVESYVTDNVLDSTEKIKTEDKQENKENDEPKSKAEKCVKDFPVMLSVKSLESDIPSSNETTDTEVTPEKSSIEESTNNFSSDVGNGLPDNLSKTQTPMDLETAAITIQKVFRTFMFKSRASTLDDIPNYEGSIDIPYMPIDNAEEVVESKEADDEYAIPKERRTLGISRMDTVLQTVNEEKSLSLSTDDSSLSSAATTIQAHVRGFLVRNRLNSNKTNSNSSFVNDSHATSSDMDNETPKNKTVLNIHIVPEGGHFVSRDESIGTSIDLPFDVSPRQTNIHSLGSDINERRKQLKREDAIQSVSPPSNNSGKLSEDVESVKELPLQSEVTENETSAQEDDGYATNKELDLVSGETTPTKSTTADTVIDLYASKIVEDQKKTDVEERRKRLIKMSSDEMDVVTPSDAASETKLLHSGEFHDVLLPTRLSRTDSSVAREFKSVLVYFLLWNNS